MGNLNFIVAETGIRAEDYICFIKEDQKVYLERDEARLIVREGFAIDNELHLKGIDEGGFAEFAVFIASISHLKIQHVCTNEKITTYKFIPKED